MSTYLGQEEITSYIASKHGISRALSKRILQDICDVICVGLILPKWNHTTNVPRIGTFRLSDSKDNIVYEPSPSRVRYFQACLEDKSLEDKEQDLLDPGME